MYKTGCGLSALALLSTTLAGCAITPKHNLAPRPAPTGCHEIITSGACVPLPPSNIRQPAAVVAPDDGPPEESVSESLAESNPIETMLTEMLSQPLKTLETEANAEGKPDVSQSVLVLSGGSQQGAFGAGFLKGWADHPARGGTLPRFRLVTGISTGSLQATFAFLGRTDVPLREYRISDEAQLLKPLVKGRLDQKPLSAGRSLATKGTLARLTPLRERLNALITPDIMKAVADEALAGRQLLVGAVEMGTGELSIFKLTEAAKLHEARKKTDPAGAEQMRQCYIEALLASSSVPMQADPVFIDNRLYIDGGARFGVLVDFTAKSYEAAIAKTQQQQREPNTPRNLFLIVNATLEVPRFCGLERCPVDDEGKPIEPGIDDPHPKWNFAELAQRTVSVMTNQAYRSSVFMADKEFRDKGFKTRFLRLDPAHLNFTSAITFDGVKQEPRTCWQWRLEDERIDKPMEFFPRYMHCLAEFGLAQEERIAAFAKAEPR